MAYLQAIEKLIGGSKSKSFNRIYRATEHGCSPDMFHLHCNSKGPTVTIFHSLNNVIYGGYTKQSWTSEAGVYKTDDSAFLFYKDDHVSAICNKIPIKPDRTENAIKCDVNLGPTFGFSWFNPQKRHDLLSFRGPISLTRRDGMPPHFVLDGYVNINGSYHLEGVKSGQITGGQMNVREIEVYQVTDDDHIDDWKRKAESVDLLKEKLKKLEPFPQLGIDQFNILMAGIVGSGKSSFYNTIASAMKSQIVCPAAAASAEYSVTNTLSPYTLATGTEEDNGLKIKIFDSRGVEQNRGLEQEAKYLLEGLLPDGYEFPDTVSPFEEKQFEQKRSTLKDQIHLVCFVMDATKVEIIQEHEELKARLKALQKVVHQKGLPTVVVMTKIDEVCQKVGEKLDTLYKSPKIKGANDKVAKLFGIPESLVFPVCNYRNEETNCQKIDALVLHALLSMAKLIQHYLETKKVTKLRVDPWTSRGGQMGMKKEFQKESIVRQLQQEFTKDPCPVLLIGETSAGKSSYINSLISALTDNICSRVETGTSPTSITSKFQAFPLKYKDPEDNLIPVTVKLCDMPGALQAEGGISINKIEYILYGNVPSGYKIKDEINPDSKGFRKNPASKYKIHCVCFVFDVSKSELPIAITNKIITILQNEDIPYMFLMTKIDQICPDIKGDTAQVFNSKILKQKVDQTAKDLDKRLLKFFPIRNYEHESVCDNDMDVLILDSFQKILELCQEYNELERSDSED